MIDTEKLAGITTLASGAHTPDSGAMCAMEAAAYIAGEPWSDHPQCVSPVIASFMRSWNDALADADRTRLLLPLIPHTVGTRTTDADEDTRSWMATDWLVRVQTPAWLRLAGLTDHAQALESCARIVDATTAHDGQPKIAAALAAARAAAWAAARAAARAALSPTVATLQASACDLVRAMCAVGRTDEQEMGR